MYIAFKWLLGLTLTMWIAVCSLSLVIRTHGKTGSPDLPVTKRDNNDYLNSSNIQRNYISSSKYNKLKNNVSKYKVIEAAYLYYAMFLAAAFVIAIVNQNSKLYLLTKDKINEINIKSHLNGLQSGSKFCYLNVTAISSVAIRGCLSIARKVGKSMASCLIKKNSSGLSNKWVHMLVIKRLEEIVEEKNRLTLLLLPSTQENKNLKARNHLETVTKNRLMKLIEDSQKDLKNYKTRFASLQNLQLASHQENISLKTRLEKLTRKNFEIDKNLMVLVRKIYESKHEELMDFCDKLVLNKENLQSIEIRNEIRKLFKKPNTPSADISETCDLHQTSSMTTALLQSEIMREKFIPFVSLKPKPKSHHGEYLWTVKDRDGLIERIYEYDNYDADYDNGDMIRRIREYSVFCDKDCVLDGKRSRAILNNRTDYLRLKIADQKFLTGSEAFQTFLRNNKTLVAASPRSPPQSPRRSTHLICG